MENQQNILLFWQGCLWASSRSSKTFVIDDVAEEKITLLVVFMLNSKSCSYYKKQIVVGQIDIDSHTPAAFKQDDQQLLEKICRESVFYIE